MIYYDIQHHANTDRLEWLCRLLDDTGNIINISLDVDQTVFDEFTAGVPASNFAARLSFNRSFPVTWCGASSMYQARDMLERAMAVEGWEYFINLSGTCFPTRTQQEIKQRLLEEKRLHAKTSFCFGFEVFKPPVWILGNEPAPVDGYSARNYYRLRVMCDSRVQKAFVKEGFDPVVKPAERRGIACTENHVDKTLILRSLKSWEFKDRVAFWNAFGYFSGRAWTVLHRKQVEWLLYSSLLTPLSDQLAQTFCPDESFLPSMLFSSCNPLRGMLSKNNLRYRLGTPSYITADTLDTVYADDCLFARKLSPNIDSASMERIRLRAIGR